MYKDIITYELAKGVSDEHLLKVADRIIEEWMKGLNGFVKWEIHKMTDGSFMDIVSWATEQDAKVAEAEMMKIPNAIEWFACYKEDSIKGIRATVIAEY